MVSFSWACTVAAMRGVESVRVDGPPMVTCCRRAGGEAGKTGSRRAVNRGGGAVRARRGAVVERGVRRGGGRARAGAPRPPHLLVDESRAGDGKGLALTPVAHGGERRVRAPLPRQWHGRSVVCPSETDRRVFEAHPRGPSHESEGPARWSEGEARLCIFWLFAQVFGVQVCCVYNCTRNGRGGALHI